MEDTALHSELIDEHYFPKQYAAQLLMIDRGEGSYVFDSAGKRYLDFGAGIAVNALGYGREDIAGIAYEQMKKIIHVSNLYTTEPAVVLSAKLAATGNFSAVHFGNSGSEANEAALKYARLYSLEKKGAGSHKFACFTNGFHGRTMGALSCTPKEKYQNPFAPLVPGVTVLPYNNPEEVRTKLDPSYAAVIVEPVQGEGGLDHLTPDFAAALNETCKKHDIILIADEVQTGCGRTGEFYSSSWTGLEPDIITLSKPLAGGLPLSATLIPDKINSLLYIGAHGTTFGGGPVTAAVANYILDIIFNPEFLAEVKKKGEMLSKKMKAITPVVKGAGMLLGMQVDDPDKIPLFIEKARSKGLLILRSGNDIIRIAPPLTISKQEIEEGTKIIQSVYTEIYS